MPHRPPLSRLLLSLLILCAAAPAACVEADTEAGTAPLPAPHVRAVTLDARGAPSPDVLPRLRDLGVTHVALVSFGFQPAADVPEIRMHTDARWYSESDAGIRALARQADSLGLRLILKPQLWLRDAWSAEVGFDTDAQWSRWESAYQRFILHYARLAQEVGAPILVVGTELGRAVRARPAFWRALIAEIRTVYDGRLTYAANWHEDYEHVAFWDALDYIGVQAYFPLSDTTTHSPDIDALKRGWTPHAAAIERLAEEAGRPVLFTEVGYRSVPYAAAEPWRWPSREEHGVVPPDYDLQARLYQAFFETVWRRPWCAGAVVWKFYPNPAGRHGRAELDFTPQGKPAEEVIRTFFTR